MSNFMIGFNAVMPMMMYIVLGQFFARAGLIKDESYSQLNRTLFKVLLPLNLFTNVYNSNFREEAATNALAFVMSYAILIFAAMAVVIPVFQKTNKRRGVMLQGSIRSNAILFGLPLGTSLLGENNLGLITIVLAVIVPLNNILSVVSLSIYSEVRVTLNKIAMNILKNPMVIFTIIGIIVSLFKINLPTFAETTLNNISAMVSPLALMVMGGTFRFDKLKDIDWSLYFTVIAKLIVVPALALLLGSRLGFRDQSIVAILIATAGPTAVSSYAQALAAGGDGDLANQIVVFTTSGSMFSLVLWIYLLKTMGQF